MRSTRYFAGGGSLLCVRETRVGVSRISETGLRKRFGAIWHEPASVEASDGNGGVKNGCMGLWDSLTITGYPIPRHPGKPLPHRIGLINFDVKCAGARSAGNPHAACDVAGVGDGITETPTRARRWQRRKQPRWFLRIYAPTLDPTRRCAIN